jgi:heme exporter protein A
MTETVPVLQAKDLECIRGECLLFSKLNFAIYPGQALQIEGANGSGKTSLMRILAGLSPPHDGEILWRGENIVHQRPVFYSEVAYLGHHLGLKSELTVGENLRLGLAMKGIPHEIEKIHNALTRVGLTDRLDLPVRALSAGQRQRVAVARLLASNVTLWILDEPFTALDVGGVALMQNLLEQHLAQGSLAILTSHQTVAIGGSLIQLTLE